jgi:tRNA 2-selenouridine synthase
MASRAPLIGIDRLAEYANRIDVRSPSEYAIDHIPGASSNPVLDDEQRARIGTLHAQSTFDARRLGAALVSRNIATMLETAFADKPREWQPIVYCWRGGKRSGALAHVMNEVGWRAVQLAGGYKAYRGHVIERLSQLPDRFDYRVICGVTGSGKSRLLTALDRAGAQVLDLEALAQHRGSLLGDLPTSPQPSQKAFETALLRRLETFDAARPVYVESESRKVGEIRVPQNLLDRMWESRCITLETTDAQRIALLREEYAHFIADPAALDAKLMHLVPLRGADTVGRWRDMGSMGDWDALVGDLLVTHYDPTYLRSIRQNFPLFGSAARIDVEGIDDPAFDLAATRVLESQAALP